MTTLDLAPLADPEWRYDNLYTVETKDGHVVPFRRNEAQVKLWSSRHNLNLILKARQLGFTTFIQIVLLDACLFYPNTQAGTIAHTIEDAERIFRSKIRNVYARLPREIREAVPAAEDSAKTLSFANGSSIRVGTSLRGGTFQYLHISEYGKVCAKTPEKAREIRTGALNTLQAGQVAFIESTAEGQDGIFYEMIEIARTKERMGDKLTPLDWRFHFFPWHSASEYSINPIGVHIPPHVTEYLDDVEDELDITFTQDQAAWYAKKLESQGDEMRREFPSTPDEAFAGAVEGAFYGRELGLAQSSGRVGSWPYDPRLGGVYTFHDIGLNDTHTIWIAQYDHGFWRFVDYYENENEGAPFYAKILADKARDTGWHYICHYLPHDGATRDFSLGVTRAQAFQLNGVSPIRIVPRTKEVATDIIHVRNFLGIARFDRDACAQGLRHLASYRREWNDKRGVWADRARHDQASHGADGFRTAAMADHHGLIAISDRREAYDDGDDYTRNQTRNTTTGY